jgi:hypothetical protein
MEAASPPPEPSLATAPPPSAPEKAGPGLRVLAIVGFVVLAFATAVIVSVMVDLGGGPLCKDVGGAANPTEDCWDVSSGGQVISLVLGWPGAILGGLAALSALAFTFTGRNGRRFWLLTLAAVVLSALSIAAAQVL